MARLERAAAGGRKANEQTRIIPDDDGHAELRPPVPRHSRFVSDPAVPEVRLLYVLYPGLPQASTPTHCRIRAGGGMRWWKERGSRGLKTQENQIRTRLER